MAETKTLTERRTLEKAYLDWRSVKTQMSAATLLTIASVWLSYLPTLRLGFMGNDFSRLARLLSHGLNFDCLPVDQLSLWLNFILGHTHSGLFHAFNIIIYSVCAALVGLITLEFSGRQGNRQGATAALWAGLLFSVYPLAQGAVAAISERQSILGLCFYLSSIYAYQRFTLLKEGLYLKLSLLAALLASFSTPAAISLPFVITALGQGTLAQRMKALPWPFFLIALPALAFPETRTYLSNCTRFDINPWRLFTANNETLLPTKKLLLPSIIVAAAAASTVIARVGLNENSKKAAASESTSSQSNQGWPVLIFWLGLTLITTASGISPEADLVDSSRYVFVAAPFCALLAFLLCGRSDMKKPREKIVLSFSILPLAALYIFWSQVLATNLKPWQDAAAVMGLMRHQIQLACQGGPVRLLDLPSRLNGVPYFLNSGELEAMLKPPFSGQDLSGRVKLALVDEPSDSGEILTWLNHGKDGLVVMAGGTSKNAKKVSELNFTEARADSEVRQLAESNGFIIEEAGQWHTSEEKNKIELTGAYARITNVSYKPVMLWLPWKIEGISRNPLALDGARQIDRPALCGGILEVEGENQSQLTNPEIAVVWREAEQENVPNRDLKIAGDGTIDLGLLPGFQSTNKAKIIGIKIAPRQTLIFKKLRLREN